MNVVNPTPTLTQVCSQAEHLKVLISQMDLTIKSPSLAGRLSHYTHNWEHIMQDRWVLQAISGYPLELTQAPHQMRQTQAIKCSAEEHIKITMGVSDLLTKGAIVESQESTGGYVSQIFLVEKRGGTEASNKPQGPQLLHKSRTFQDGRPSSPSRSNPESGLDGETGPEGCLPTGPNPSGTPMSPPIPVGA